MTDNKMSKAVMSQYLKYITPDMTHGDVFAMVRDIEKPTPEEFRVDNWDEFYFFIRDHRDELKNA